MKGNPKTGLFIEARKTGVDWCYIDQRPKAKVEYARNGQTRLESEALTSASIQAYYQECRRNGGVTWVGD